MNNKGCKKEKCKFLHPPICKLGKGCDKRKCPGVHLDQKEEKRNKQETKENVKATKKQTFLEEGGLKKMMESMKKDIIREIRHQILGTLTYPQFPSHPPHPWRVIQ